MHRNTDTLMTPKRMFCLMLQAAIGATLALLVCAEAHPQTAARRPASLQSAGNRLDLNTIPALKTNLLDCQLRVEGRAPDYRLIHSGGAIAVAPNRLRFENNSPYVQIAVSGTFHALTVTALRVPYHKDSAAPFQGLWAALDPSLGPVKGNQPLFQFAQSARTVATVMSRVAQRKFRLIPRPGPDVDDSDLVFTSVEEAYPRLQIGRDGNGASLEYQCLL